jgi:hypothetical protein
MAWTEDEEEEFKIEKKALFSEKYKEALERYADDPLEIGNHLAELLRELERDAVELITPRAVKKWASRETLPRWEEMISDEDILLELRAIGKSITNSLRPLAGNAFAQWIAETLNRAFHHQSLSLMCVTKGKIKEQLSKRLIVRGIDYKPDLDIVVVRTTLLGAFEDPIAVISAKTTLAERVMQTINWRRFLHLLPEDVRNIRVYLVTAWETFEGKQANRDRVQELDGVYVCNSEVREYGKIKRFSKLIDDLRVLIE